MPESPMRMHLPPGPAHRHQSAVGLKAGQALISVIIPVRDEARLLGPVLDSALAAPHVEVLVVDGGSQDGTLEIARRRGVCVLQSAAGRACQMNRAARAARGDVLLFLHGDTLLPRDFQAAIEGALGQPGAVAGAFCLGTDDRRPALRAVCGCVRLRSRLLQMPYGDQGLFMRAETFHALGGFPDLPIMEDFQLVRMLRRRGRIVLTRSCVTTSSRRWVNCGVLRTTLLNQISVLAFLLGVSAQRIATWHGSGRRIR